MTRDNPYLDGTLHIDPNDVHTEASRYGKAVLTFQYQPRNAKPGHYREVEIEMDRYFVAYVSDALYDYLENEEADVRKLRERLQGQRRTP